LIINTLKAYLSTQPSSLSASIISKTQSSPKAFSKTAKHKSVYLFLGLAVRKMGEGLVFFSWEW